MTERLREDEDPVVQPGFTPIDPLTFHPFLNFEAPDQAQAEVKQHPRRLPKTTRHKNVTRIDHPAKRTFGYFVRVQWKGERRVKFFSDKVYGDRLGALAAALEWRDGIEKELGKPRTEHQVVGKTRNTSGVIGVRRRTDEGVPAYEASWIEDGKVRRTKFSVRKYGERKARALAIKLRQQKERERWRSPRKGGEK